MDRWVDGWVDRQTDGRDDRWMEGGRAGTQSLQCRKKAFLVLPLTEGVLKYCYSELEMEP